MFSKSLSVISTLPMVRLAKFDEIRIFFFCPKREVMMNSLCACQCRESFQNVIVPSLGPSRIDFVTQRRLDTALSECSTSHYSTVHRDDFEGKSHINSELWRLQHRFRCSRNSNHCRKELWSNGEQQNYPGVRSGAKRSETSTFKLFQGILSDFAGKHSDLCDLLSELWRNWWVAGIRERSNTFTVILRTYLIGWEKFLVGSSLHLRAKHCFEKKYRGFSRWTTISVAMTNKKLDDHKIV